MVSSTTFSIDEEAGVITCTFITFVNPVTEGVGTSFCHEEDEWDEDIGKALAASRALKNAARNLEREAREEVAARDAFREYQAEQQRLALAKTHAKKVKFQLEFAKLIKALHPEVFPHVPKPLDKSKLPETVVEDSGEEE